MRTNSPSADQKDLAISAGAFADAAPSASEAEGDGLMLVRDVSRKGALSGPTHDGSHFSAENS